MREIRKSVAIDYEAIKNIIEQSFGTGRNAYEGIDAGRYLVYTVDSVPVAMTGLCMEGAFYTNYQPEVDYTAVLPMFRNKGIMTALFGEMLKDAPSILYYSAWRNSHDYKHAAAEKLLQHFGFIEIKRPHLEFRIGSNCRYKSSAECVYYTGIDCYCYEDLWYYKGK